MSSAWRFAIISDIHIRSGGQVPERFPAMVQRLCEMAPRFIVVNGDATVGNPNDGVDAAKVTGWWQSFRESLGPIRAAGIPILAIAGNHDYYTDAQKKGYAAAWSALREEVSGLVSLSGNPPFSYSFVLDGVYFLFLHVVDQVLSPEVEAFARAELASDAARSASLRLCCGHVPLVSMMGKSSQSFCDKLGGLLADGGVAAYFSGHEHLYWDQALSVGDAVLRQIHVGTSSGAYHFPLSAATYAAHCSGNSGTIPYTGTTFQLHPGTRNQKDEVITAVVNIHLGDGGPGYDVQPLSLRDGNLLPFGSL